MLTIGYMPSLAQVSLISQKGNMTAPELALVSVAKAATSKLVRYPAANYCRYGVKFP